jgi:hypothetical protein
MTPEEIEAELNRLQEEIRQVRQFANLGLDEREFIQNQVIENISEERKLTFVARGGRYDVNVDVLGATTIDETTVTPDDPTDGDQCRFYMKGDKFIIQYNDSGTIRYKYLTLTGTGVTWTHTTTAP